MSNPPGPVDEGRALASLLLVGEPIQLDARVDNRAAGVLMNLGSRRLRVRWGAAATCGGRRTNVKRVVVNIDGPVGSGTKKISPLLPSLPFQTSFEPGS